MSLSGKHFTFAANEHPPYMSLEFEENSQKWVINGGFEGRIIETMREHLNFTYDVVNCYKQFGQLLPNKTWVGIVGKVAYKIADFGLSELSITNDRLEVVDFSIPYTIIPMSFITRPALENINITLIFEPFDQFVWICVSIAFIVYFSILWIISHNSIQLNKFDLKWDIFRIFVRQQMTYQTPSVGSLRIIICFWLLTSFVLTSIYSGCLYSLMTLPSKIKNVETLKELAFAQKNGYIQVIAIGSSSNFQLMKESKIKAHKAIGELIKPVKTPDEGFNLVMNSTKYYALIGSRFHLEYEMMKYNSRSFYIPPETPESTLNIDLGGIAFQKQFQFKNLINDILSNMIEGGLINNWRLVEIEKVSSLNRKFLEFFKNVNIRIDSMRLNQFLSTFAMFIIGVKISSILFLIEKMKLSTQKIKSSIVEIFL